MIVSIELDVLFGELSVYLMNDTEFIKFNKSQQFSAFYVYENVENLSVTLQFNNKANMNLVLVNNEVAHSVPFYLKLVADTEPLLDPSIRDLFFQIWLILLPILLFSIFIIKIKRSKRNFEQSTTKNIKFLFSITIEDILGIFGIKSREGFFVWLILGYFSTLILMLTPIKYFNVLNQNFISAIIDIGITLILYIVLTILLIILIPHLIYEFMAGTSYYYNLVFDACAMLSPIILASIIMLILENKSPENPIFLRETPDGEKSRIIFGNYNFKASREQKQIWSKINFSEVDKSLNSVILNQLMNIFPGSSIKLEEMTRIIEYLVKGLNLTTDQIEFRIKTFINTINYFKYDYDTNSVMRIELTGEMGFNHVKWIENEDNSYTYLIDPYIINKKNYLLFMIIGLFFSIIYLGLGLFYTNMTYQTIENLLLAIIISYTFLIFLFILVFNIYKENAVAFTDKNKVNSVYKITIFVFLVITMALINSEAIFGFLGNEMTISLRKFMIFFIIYIIELIVIRVLIPFVIIYFNLKVGHQHFNIDNENEVLSIDRKYFSFTRHKEQIQIKKIVKLLVVDEEIKDFVHHKAESKENKLSRNQKRVHRFHLYAIMNDQSQKLILTTRIYRILLNVKNKIEEISLIEAFEN